MIYSNANLTTNITDGNPALEIIAASTAGYKLLECVWTNTVANVNVIGLGFPQVIGVTPTSPVLVQAEDQNNTTAGQTKTALAWGTNPTVPANFLDRKISPAVLGGGYIWSWPKGITVSKGSSLVLWNIIHGVAMNVWVVVEE